MQKKSKEHKYNNKSIRPFLKWAGNKFRIMDKIHEMLPPDGKRLIEPFAGSAAVFLNTNYEHYLISDSNPDLINLYNILKKEGNDFIKYCKRYFTEKNNASEKYYSYREQFNKTTEIRRRSALFIYLNRHGYNGLCRYNSKGGFNVPFGRYKKPYFPEKEMLEFHHKAKHATFKISNFDKIMTKSKQGDVIYCDPPYVPLSSSANFTTYSSGGFIMDQQQQLSTLAEKLAKRGIPVLISNHKTKDTDKFYKNAQRKYFKVRRFISCNGNKRIHAGEVLALFSNKK